MKFTRLAPAKECALLFLISFIWLCFLNPHSLPSIFQDRDIMRAAELASGKLILFGPEATGGGHLPGNFYYILLAIPLKLGLGWSGCLTLMALLTAAAVALLWRYLEKNFNRETAYLALICLFTTRHFFGGYVKFWNPSYLNLFTVAVLVGLGSAFSKSEEEGGRNGWFLACLCLGLGMQIHMSISILLTAAILMQVFSSRLRLQTLRPAVFFGGLLLIGLLLSPYMIWKTLNSYNISFGVSPPGFVGNKLSSSSGMMAELPFKLDQIEKPARLFARVKLTLFTGFSFMLPLLFGIFLYARLKRKPTVPKESVTVRDRLFTVWACCFAVSIWPALLMVLYPGRGRYFVCFIVVQAFALAAWTYRLVDQQKRMSWLQVYGVLLVAGIVDLLFRFSNRHIPFTAITATLLVAGVIGAIVAWKIPRVRIAAVILAALAILPMAPYFDTVGHNNKRGMTVHNFTAVSKSIIEQTGWSYQEARGRLFFVNIHFQRTPELIYEQLHKDWAANSGGKVEIAGEVPSGFFVAFDRNASKMDSPTVFTSWLRRQNVQPWITNGLKRKEIRLGKIDRMQFGYLVPYFVEDLKKQPLHLHNVGISYTSENSCLTDRGNRKSSIDQLNDGISFAFNDCPDRAEHCDICFKLSRESNANGNFLRLKLTGDILSRASSWINPDWNQNIERPFVKIQCKADGPVSRVNLISRIGFVNEARFSKFMNRSVLTPLERQIPNPCDGPIHKVVVGYQGSEVLYARELKKLKGNHNVAYDF